MGLPRSPELPARRQWCLDTETPSAPSALRESPPRPRPPGLEAAEHRAAGLPPQALALAAGPGPKGLLGQPRCRTRWTGRLRTRVSPREEPRRAATEGLCAPETRGTKGSGFVTCHSGSRSRPAASRRPRLWASRSRVTEEPKVTGLSAARRAGSAERVPRPKPIIAAAEVRRCRGPERHARSPGRPPRGPTGGLRAPEHAGAETRALPSGPAGHQLCGSGGRGRGHRARWAPRPHAGHAGSLQGSRAAERGGRGAPPVGTGAPSPRPQRAAPEGALRPDPGHKAIPARTRQ